MWDEKKERKKYEKRLAGAYIDVRGMIRMGGGSSTHPTCPHGISLLSGPLKHLLDTLPADTRKQVDQIIQQEEETP